jgi:multidrug efflux pump
LEKVKDIPGIVVEIEKDKPGPSKGKPIELLISGTNEQKLKSVTKKIRDYLENIKGLSDIEDTLPMPGIEWQYHIDRAQAARYGSNIQHIGQMIQMVAGGLKVTEYRPDNSRNEIDLTVRFPEKYRHLDQIEQLQIQTPKGKVPLRNMVKREAHPRVGTIHRYNSKRFYLVLANVIPGVLVDDKVKEIELWLQSQTFDPDVEVIFKGEEEDKKETGLFLMKAFGIAVFLILLILVTQFNSFFSAFLVMTSVVFSTFGVFVGLLVTHQPFGIVMGGLGVIALAGIIVSNNIIFIDTFDRLRKKGQTFAQVKEVILRTGAQRLRPVILTKLTTILGLLPILLRMDLDFIHGQISFGAPSTEWWIQLSTAIVFGVAFASVLTLILTPCALMLREKWRFRKQAI